MSSGKLSNILALLSHYLLEEGVLEFRVYSNSYATSQDLSGRSREIAEMDSLTLYKSILAN